MTIALLGDPDDLAITYISWQATRRDIDVLLLPEATLGVDWSFALREAPDDGFVRSGTRFLALGELSGIFVRLNPVPPLPPGLSLDPSSQALFIHERREGLHHFLQAMRCPVVNRPSAGRANASKPLQMMQLRDAGFAVPRWLVTNNRDAATAFAGGCPGGVIYKATSGLRSRVQPLNDQLLDRLREGTTPTVIQEYIPGRDVRVHTVGDQAFATEMLSDAIDYRFEPATQYRATAIDGGLAQRCCTMARKEGLLLAGFDFRVTPNDQWQCLEMNPVPSFLPYEMCSGEPIGEAVLDLFRPSGEHVATAPSPPASRQAAG